MAKRRQKKHATVILQVGMGHETKHRGKTIQTALAAGVRSRLPKSCTVRWLRMEKLATVAGGEGRIDCGGSRDWKNTSIRFVAMRTRGAQFKFRTRRKVRR